MGTDHPGSFAETREEALAAEAASWDTARPLPAEPGDIPIIDVAGYFATGDEAELESLADQLRYVGEDVGFHFLIGHGITDDVTSAAFEQAAAFLTQPDHIKRSILIDAPDAAAPGIGYMPIGERRLPTRAKGNLNEAVLFKRDRTLALADNPWPDPASVPHFRAAIETYAAEIERVALALLPIYARALDLDADYFTAAFESPFYRLRCTRYAAPIADLAVDDYGIAPHVDTTFFTLLAQSSAGLVLFGEQRQEWLEVPLVPDALVVNSGELLKQWSNDRFVSVKHFVPPHRDTSADRYSIPFFFNATADYPMACLPTCHGPENPPKYPTVSYLESQAAAQRE